MARYLHMDEGGGLWTVEDDWPSKETDVHLARDRRARGSDGSADRTGRKVLLCWNKRPMECASSEDDSKDVPTSGVLTRKPCNMVSLLIET